MPPPPPWGRLAGVLGIAFVAALAGSLVGGEIGRRAGAAAGYVGAETIFYALLGGAVGSLLLVILVALLVPPRLGTPRGWSWAAAGVGLAADWAIWSL